LEVEIDPEYGEEAMREERRAKIWSGIVVGGRRRDTAFRDF